MKRIIAFGLFLSLLLGLCGCSAVEKKDAVTFYYRKADYQFGTASGAIGQESREISGQKTNLTYLMSLYFLGPSDDSLKLPFPQGTKVVSAAYADDTVEITLVPGGSMSESAFTLGASCIAMTCFGLTQAQAVRLITEKKELTIERDTIVSTDESIEN